MIGTKPAKVDFCECLIHPFQNDPGNSQRQRVMEELLSGQAKIDPRKMADLLDYFYQLSRQINYYDNTLGVSDWQPFFEKSIPFVLATLIKYNAHSVKEKFNLYNSYFEKKPSPAGLQLAQLFIFYNTLRRIHNWYSRIKGSELPVERVFENIIKDKIRPALIQFIALNRLAAKYFGTASINFKDFINNDVWKLPAAGQLEKQIIDQEASLGIARECNLLLEIHTRTNSLFPSFFEPITILNTAAEQSLDQSFIPLKEEFQKQHLPHLGLLFAFLNLFTKLQGDLNGFTKKHLDFFYKRVLKLIPREAVPDKAHIVFEIQKELDKYKLEKGLLVKDGKDTNKQEILFSLDEEIVVNKAQVKDTRTLYLNDKLMPHGNGGNVALLEGVYMAPNATMADGVDKDFQTEIKNYYTVGNKESKYFLPGTDIYKPYPNARLGFILSSPVLLLREGKRTVTITLQCLIDEQLCNELKTIAFPAVKRCCDDSMNAVQGENFNYHPYLGYDKLFANLTAALNDLLNKEYYYISEELIAAAAKKGLSSEIAKTLRTYLVVSNEVSNSEMPKPYCFCPIETKIFDTIILAGEFEKPANKIDITLEVVKEFFKKRKPFSLQFSGEKEWILPSEDPKVNFAVSGFNIAANEFTLTIEAVLNPDKDPVVFYDKEKLKEDFDSTDPLVKIEMDDHFKIKYSLLPDEEGGNCCLDKKIKDEELPVSLYHFFRNVKVLPSSKIDVQVCGLTTFVVQNDESVMDVNGPIYPFGSRPDIIDYSLNPNSTYCLTQRLLDEIQGIIGNARLHLQRLVNEAPDHRVKIDVSALKAFLDQTFTNPNYHFTDIEKTKITDQLKNASKNYCDKNFIGPNFFIGSKEVFCKNWTEVYINLNWKDKPADFNEYYVAYTADPTPPKPGDKQKIGLDESEFEIQLAVLQEGKWKNELEHKIPTPLPPRPPETTLLNTKTHFYNRKLFPIGNKPSFCNAVNPFDQTIYLKNDFFDTLNGRFTINALPLDRYTSQTRNGFLKVNLQNQDFLHKDYAFVLARQMMALARYPDALLEGAVYRDAANGTIIVFSNFINLLGTLTGNITAAKGAADVANLAAKTAFDDFTLKAGLTSAVPDPQTDIPTPAPTLTDPIDVGERDILYNKIYTAYYEAFQSAKKAGSVESQFQNIQNLYNVFNLIVTQNKLNPLNVPIPNEPWTPIIKNIAIDYKATATIKDTNLIHLYPYKDTFKHEAIQLQPTLLPSFCDEGTLFIGLEGLVPGSNLNILFQLAEATADSESQKEQVHWHYLDNNVWKPLRKGFEVLNDATENLTSSGIIKFALPEEMTSTNTVMPKDLHWIKATIPKNSKSVSETTGIHTQAVQVTFTNAAENDKLRLDKPIEASSISKLETADASVKQVVQPYETFGGEVPEMQQLYYVRVSELLRHKGRSIQKFDYERITLNAFPQLFKAKCINHSFWLNAHHYENDFPYAPGYVMMAVIPDLTKLKAGNTFEPKAPVSLLEKIDAYIRKRTSPFVRFRAVNPRYEKIHFCLKVKLVFGKDENYHKDKLKKDLRGFMAPWAIGDPYNYKLSFGQCINRSNIVGFLESLDYIDYILSLNMRHESLDSFEADESKSPIKICPVTPRSILIAGDIDVCIDPEICEDWNKELSCDHTTIKLIECKPRDNL